MRLWDVRGAKEIQRLLDVPGKKIDSVAVSPDGRWIATGGYYYDKVHLFAAATGKLHHELDDARGGGLAFSSDSKRLACGGPDAEVELRDVVSGRKLHSLKGHKYGVHALAFSPDGKLLASSTLLDRALLLWDPNEGKLVRKITGDLGALQCLTFTLDRKWLIAEGRGNGLSLWDVATGEETPHFPGMHGYMVHALSPNGRMVAVAAFGGNDKDIRVYEVASGKERCRFEGHLSRVYSLAFSPDNRTLASGGEDTSVLLWDLSAK